jgi:hypothetical protein
MSGAVDILRRDSPNRVLIVASNPAVSEQTGWPIGFGGPSSPTPTGSSPSGVTGWMWQVRTAASSRVTPSALVQLLHRRGGWPARTRSRLALIRRLR